MSKLVNRKLFETKSFGQRMKELRHFKRAAQIAKLRDLINPFDSRIAPNLQIEIRNKLKPLPIEITEEPQPYVENLVDKAMDNLRRAAAGL